MLNNRRICITMSSPNEEEDLLWAVGTAAQQRQWLQEDRRRCRDIQQWLASERKNFEARVLAWEKEKTVEEEKMVLVKAQMTLERATWEKEKKKREMKKKDSNKDDQTIQQEGDHGGEGMILQISNVMTVASSNDWSEFGGEEEEEDPEAVGEERGRVEGVDVDVGDGVSDVDVGEGVSDGDVGEGVSGGDVGEEVSGGDVGKGVSGGDVG